MRDRKIGPETICFRQEKQSKPTKKSRKEQKRAEKEQKKSKKIAKNHENTPVLVKAESSDTPWDSTEAEAKDPYQ
jgi:hypothetical protein